MKVFYYKYLGSSNVFSNFCINKLVNLCALTKKVVFLLTFIAGFDLSFVKQTNTNIQEKYLITTFS